MSGQMKRLVLFRIIGFLEHGDIVRAAFVQIGIFIRIHRIHFKPDDLEIFTGNPAGLADIFHGRLAPALAGKNENFLQARLGNLPHFLVDLLLVQLCPVNLVVAVKSAVYAEVLTVIGYIDGREHIDAIAKMLSGLDSGTLRHLLQKRQRRRGQKRRKILRRTIVMLQRPAYVLFRISCIIIGIHRFDHLCLHL